VTGPMGSFVQGAPRRSFQEFGGGGGGGGGFGRSSYGGGGGGDEEEEHATARFGASDDDKEGDDWLDSPVSETMGAPIEAEEERGEDSEPAKESKY